MAKKSVRFNRALPEGTPHVPVAIVGAGACGLVAAIALRDQGIECVVLERDARPQGSTALSSGFIPAAGTQAQRTAGVRDDSLALFEQDIQTKAKQQAAPHLVKAYAAAACDALDTLSIKHGFEFDVLDGFLYPGHSKRRMHSLPQRTGQALVAALEAKATELGALILTNAFVLDVWVDRSNPQRDGKRIQGVSYQRSDGTMEHLACDALLLACNGYGGNARMVERYLPAFKGAPFTGHQGNDGSALDWAEQLGAGVADLGACQGHGSWAIPHGMLITWALMTKGGVQLNANGERFHDETGGYSEAAVAVNGQPGGYAWNVFDGKQLQLAMEFPDFQEAQATGAVKTAGDVAQLAALIGCSEEAIRNSLAPTMLQTPYYAIKVAGALFHTQGGLDVDEHCKVLAKTGFAPFANLWAAGGAARGVSGPAEWGYLSGNGLLSAVGGGWLAARSIAERTRR